MLFAEEPIVRLQIAIAARKLYGANAMGTLLGTLAERSGTNDKLIPHVVWQNIHPLLEDHAEDFVEFSTESGLFRSISAVRALIPRAMDRILSGKDFDPASIVKLLDMLMSNENETFDNARQCLAILADRIQTGQITDRNLAVLHSKLQPVISPILKKPDHPLHLDVALVSTTWKDQTGLSAVRNAFASKTQTAERRVQALGALISVSDNSLLDAVTSVLGDRNGSSAEFRGQVLAALGRWDDPRVADLVLGQFKQMEPDVQPKAVELLTQRTAWSKRLLAAIGKKDIPAEALNVNQVRKLLASKDAELVKLVTAQWGTVREQRNPLREAVIAEMRTLIRKTPGDAMKGHEVYKKLCGQCHKIYGEGQDVGPDITVNGRSSFDQLLSNVFDPSLVIGASYQARTIATIQGRVLTGLVSEDNDQRIVLKVQGGKQEVIPRGDIEEMKQSELSLMPEELEKQLKPQEIADLFAFLTLDRPPGDPKARQLPGVRDK